MGQRSGMSPESARHGSNAAVRGAGVLLVLMVAVLSARRMRSCDIGDDMCGDEAELPRHAERGRTARRSTTASEAASGWSFRRAGSTTADGERSATAVLRAAPVWRGRATQIGAVQTLGVRFSAPGCWRVTGRVGGKALTYVVRVTFARL
jgi:hypothetical protein